MVIVIIGAVVAWSRGDEVLIVSSSLYLRGYLEKGYAVELIPSPSIPRVEEADVKAFKALGELAAKRQESLS